MSRCVELKRISKSFPGVLALDNVQFSLHTGEVHCLVGENGSGKSTLIKILSGVETPDIGGELFIEGAKQNFYSCESALLAGIQVIYQDISLFPNLTVSENIAFRQYTTQKDSLVNKKTNDTIAKEALQLIDVDIDLHTTVSSLSIAQQQLVEIARSLTGNPKLLILDEPTASLTRKEVNALFSAINKIKERNITVLFVSHKLNEIFEIAEGVTVLRDGKIVGTYNPSELDSEKLTFLMTGQQESHSLVGSLTREATTLLELKNLSKKNNFKDISFSIKRGEILGITGLLGSGRTELALALFGLNRADSGSIYIEGEKVDIRSQTEAIAHGIAYVSENRRDLGLVQEQSIENNLTITVLKNMLNKYGLLINEKITSTTKKYIKDLDIKVSDLKAKIKTLSGGNQQKVVLSKWLATTPKLLILDEPTIGIDVIAKSNIHTLMKEMADLGMTILMISDEMREVMHNCHRVLVMDRGRITYEFLPKDENEDELLKKFNLG